MKSRFFFLMSRICGAILLALTVQTITTQIARSQTSFEYVYGGPTAIEGGFKGVEPVDGPHACTGGGYIAAGFSRSPSGGTNSDVYVVRTNNDGSRMWEFTYDLGGINGNDTAYSVREINDGSGFIITGVSDQGTTTTDIFLMKIACDGSVLWETTYGRSGRNDGGFDVIEATPQGTGVEDFIVCGYANNASSVRDAYLMRTDDQGNLIWDDTYDNSTTQAEWFAKLIQAAPTAGQTQGDIVAVGTHNNGTNLKGFVVRCSGLNGTITPGTFPNHGAADWGLTNFNTEFYSTLQLPNGNLVFVGYVNDGAIVNGSGTQDIYLAETNGGKPTIALVQTQLGDNGLNNEVGYDIIRVANTITYTGVGNLVIVGKVQISANPTYDVGMVAVDPTTLAKKLSSGRRYGDIALHSGDDIGYSIHEVNNDAIGLGGHKLGFIICGSSKSNLGRPAPVDPGDLYLLKTNGSGTTSCDSSWNPTNNTLAFDVTVRTPTVSFINQAQARNPVGTSRNWPLSVCTIFGKLGVQDLENEETPATTVNPPGASLSTLRSFPNPVKSGDMLSLSFIPTTTNTLSISITDMAGKTIRSNNIANDGSAMSVPVETKGLAAGTYTITVGDGLQNQSVRIVVQ